MNRLLDSLIAQQQSCVSGCDYPHGSCRCTLIVTGRNVRTWGFWCPIRDRAGLRVNERFVPWQEFTAAGSAGCGESS